MLEQLSSSRLSLALADSSEALMPGQKPKVQLMARAIGVDGCRLPIIPLFVSEEFVVSFGCCHWQSAYHRLTIPFAHGACCRTLH